MDLITGGLSSGSRRGLAQALFSGFFERGLSANAALQVLRDQGLGYRRQDFLRDYSQGESSYKQAVKVRYVGENRTPSEGILESRYHGVSDKYSLVFRVDYEDQNTGETGSRYFFYHRNSLDTRANMEEDAVEWASEQGGEYGIGVTGASLVEGYINPVWG